MTGDWHTQALDANPLLDRWDATKALFRPGELVAYVGWAAQDHRVYAWASVPLLLLAVPILALVWPWLAVVAFAFAISIPGFYYQYSCFRGYRFVVTDRRLLVLPDSSIPKSLDYEDICGIEVVRVGLARRMGLATLRVTASVKVVSIKAVRDADQAAHAIQTAARAVGFDVPVSGSASVGASN